MSLFTIARTDSVVGRKLVKRLLARGDQLLDPRALDHAAKIVDDVRARGDRAVRQAVRKFDGVATKDVATLCRRPMRVRGNELPPGFEAALERAILAVERYHRPQRRDGYRLDEDGIELRERRRPLKRVACYVPGGRAAYPSSVVMTVVPARLAGVPEIVVATPPGSYQRNAALRHTLARLGIEEVWTFGGAHAVAALAYGTESVPRVDKIVGPGNQWVTAAKYLTSSSVAIDGLAGPSEVVIVAGGDVDPAWIAADLLAQAEHDPLATALLITDDRSLARAVRREVSIQLRSLATASTARESLRNNGGALLVERMDDALDLLERLAP
ncbi:MAG: histidinol dehydrogenase, partial [Acidobacteriota bacterium]